MCLAWVSHAPDVREVNHDGFSDSFEFYIEGTGFYGLDVRYSLVTLTL